MQYLQNVEIFCPIKTESFLMASPHAFIVKGRSFEQKQQSHTRIHWRIGAVSHSDATLHLKSAARNIRLSHPIELLQFPFADFSNYKWFKIRMELSVTSKKVEF